MSNLNDKVVLVTGAARGQGRADAVALAAAGANLILTDVASSDNRGLFYSLPSEDDLMETVRGVEQNGRRAVAVHADVRSLPELEAAVAAGIKEFGHLDGVCANAGVLDHGSWDVDEDRWDHVMDVNLKGAWLTCRAAIPHMIERGKGSIVCIASTAALRGYHNQLAYTVSKHGVLGIVDSLCVDLGKHGIRVNALCPTMVASPMIMNQAIYDRFAGGRADATVADVEERGRHLHMLPTPWLQPEDVAAALVWLISDESRFVTGIALPVDAGALSQPNGIPASSAK